MEVLFAFTASQKYILNAESTGAGESTLKPTFQPEKVPPIVRFYL